jgi:hypothetical protein
MTVYSAEIWILWKVDQKYLEGSEVWCWRRMENIIWTDLVRNEEVLHRFKEDRNILHAVKEERLTGLITFCVGNVFQSILWMERKGGI